MTIGEWFNSKRGTNTHVLITDDPNLPFWGSVGFNATTDMELAELFPVTLTAWKLEHGRDLIWVDNIEIHPADLENK